MKPVVVLITKDGCPGCIRFKKNVWPRLGMYLKKDSRIELKEIHITKSYDEIKRVHTDLLRFIRWVPTIIVFTGESWVSTSLRGEVLNGKFIDGVITMFEKIPRYASKSVKLEHLPVYNWIERTINLPMFTDDKPAVVITNTKFEGTGRSVKTRSAKTMYDSETEFAGVVIEYD